MDLLTQWNTSACAWILARLDAVSVALAASLMVILGSLVIASIRRHIRTWHFAARTVIFVLVSGVGFGMVVAVAAPHLARALHFFGFSYLLLMTVVAFIGVGLLAERHRKI